MEPKQQRILKILETIAEGKPISQRELSTSLHISLGLVNSFMKRLVKKGYCKVTTIPKNRAIYILTPAGAMEKTRLTYEYISSSYRYFKTARNRLRILFADLKEQGTTRIVFYGAGELADIAMIAMSGTGVRLIDIVDPEREGDVFGHFTVKDSPRLQKQDYDMVLITTVGDHPTIVHTIQKAGVPSEMIRFF